MKIYIELANKVVDEYCREMGVDRQLLYKNKYKKKMRRDENGINLAFIRQSLAYYIYKRLPLTARNVGLIVGYTEHSMVSYYSRIIENHFEVQDPYFLPYYQQLEKVADPIVGEINFERVSAYWWKQVDKKSYKIRSTKQFSV